MEYDLIRQRVAKGVEFLDKSAEVENHWRKLINLTTLNIDSSATDILGQLFGNYYRALDEVGLEAGEAETMGFAPYDDESGALTQEWMLVITKSMQSEFKVGDKFVLGLVRYEIIGSITHNNVTRWGLLSGSDSTCLVREAELRTFKRLDDYSWVKPGMVLVDDKTGSYFFKVSDAGFTKVWNLHSRTNQHISGWINSYGKLNVLHSLSGVEAI